jgi:diacylglycerol kinase
MKRKFRAAFRGVKWGVRGHSSFFVHFFFTALVLAAAAALRCDIVQWCILVGCIGMVLITELINSSVETLFRQLDAATRDRAWPALDIAAGAVLAAAFFAAIIGGMVFASRLAELSR